MHTLCVRIEQQHSPVQDCLVDFLSTASREAAKNTVAKDGRPKPEDLLHVVRKARQPHTTALLLCSRDA